MALIPGMLLSYDDPLLGVVPNVIIFQYNPDSITRTFTPPSRSQSSGGDGGTRSQARPAKETYSMTLEMDATDGLERGGPLTTAFGVGPRLAALEMLLQPVGAGPLASLVGGLLGGGGANIPASRVPLVIMSWGLTRIAPVVFDSLTITETGFDGLLNPIHAKAEVGLTILRPSDVEGEDLFTRAAATYYQAAREVQSVLSIPQTFELI
ncbi:MAG: hypothetical protein ACRBK7_17455 [Acidimicrobiales bacterium]